MGNLAFFTSFLFLQEKGKRRKGRNPRQQPASQPRSRWTAMGSSTSHPPTVNQAPETWVKPPHTWPNWPPHRQLQRTLVKSPPQTFNTYRSCWTASVVRCWLTATKLGKRREQSLMDVLCWATTTWMLRMWNLWALLLLPELVRLLLCLVVSVWDLPDVVYFLGGGTPHLNPGWK